MLQRIGLALLALLLVAIGLLGWLYVQACATPVVVRYAVALPGWPKGQRPLTIALLSDIHVSGPEMPPSRVARIVGQVNALHPDLVLLAGDYVSDKATAIRVSSEEAVAPLRALHAPLGVAGVLGNHDHTRGAGPIASALVHAGVTLVDNQAVRRGPLVIAGLGDRWSGQEKVPDMLRAVARLAPGPVILVAHNPDGFTHVPRGIPLTLAGHTHGGQVVPPFTGPIFTATKHHRFAYGLIRERGHAMIVTGGLGTSGLPIRLNRPPEIVLVRVGG